MQAYWSLIDIVSSYDDEKIDFLSGIREKTIVNLATQCDPKKIFAFMKNTWIVDIDDKDKTVYIWVPNEFVQTQLKKNLWKLINTSVKNVYNDQFNTDYVIYTPFNKWWKLTVDLNKVLKEKLNITEKITKENDKKFNKTTNGLAQEFWVLFDPAFTFDNFIAWDRNNFAYSAAKAVADNPGTAYNPLFLYWDVWLGKTHLMQSIWNQIIAQDPNKVVVYLPSSKLMDEIVSATKKNNLTSFLSKFNNVDVLMVDDIQFIAGKDKIQEIFHNIFNDFSAQKKQIVISWDRPPKELTSLEPRLKSRFSLWLIVDIKSPDFETRIAILQAELESKWEYMDTECIEIIAKYVTNNVRELKWILISLISMKTLCGADLTPEFVSEYLSNTGYMIEQSTTTATQTIHSTNTKESFGELVKFAAEYYELSIEDLKSDSRKKEISNARQLLMFIAKEHFGWTLVKIWDYFGGKNHATVIHAIDWTKKRLKKDKDLTHDYSVFLERINK